MQRIGLRNRSNMDARHAATAPPLDREGSCKRLKEKRTNLVEYCNRHVATHPISTVLQHRAIEKDRKSLRVSLFRRFFEQGRSKSAEARSYFPNTRELESRERGENRETLGV